MASTLEVDQIKHSSGVAFTLPQVDGSAGQVLQTNASRVLSFGDADPHTGKGGDVASAAPTVIPDGTPRIINLSATERSLKAESRVMVPSEFIADASVTVLYSPRELPDCANTFSNPVSENAVGFASVSSSVTEITNGSAAPPPPESRVNISLDKAKISASDNADGKA